MPVWREANINAHGRATELADRHYSRQKPGSKRCVAPGRGLLLESDVDAAWAAVENDAPKKGGRRFRCSLFRNEGPMLSSDLVLEATDLTLATWVRRYGALPDVPFRTEINTRKVRKKRDWGRCFRKAGWEPWSRRRREKRAEVLFVLLAPGERARLNLQGPVLR